MPGALLKRDVVLAAEDEESDAVLLQLAFARIGSPDDLVVVHDGQQVIDYLDGRGPYADRAMYPLPRLLLLDLKMPRLTGFDVLDWLQDKPEFRGLPVVVLSSSSYETDVQKATQLGAWEYHLKPHGMSDLAQLIRQVTTRSFSAALAAHEICQ